MQQFLLIPFFFLILAATSQAAGDLDPLFGNAGKVTTLAADWNYVKLAWTK
jgi:hypothetical protein